MSDDKTIKDRFSISADELNHRMELQQKYHDEPIQKAVMILEAALDKVMTKLGVDVSQEPEHIQMQQESLGVMVTEHTDERAPQLNGFFVFISKGKELVPYAWVGSARLNSNGECFCDIQWFQDERLDEVGGVKILG